MTSPCKRNCLIEGKICNPSTKRCVSPTGKIGKEILAGIKRSRDCKKPCSADTVCNKESGRCVLKNGKIGKKILARSRTRSQKSRSESLQLDKEVLDHLHRILKGYKIIKKLGAGTYGSAFLVCKDKYDCRAVKISIFKRSDDPMFFSHEVAMQKKFAAHNLAPQIYHEEIFKDSKGQLLGIIVMDRIDGTIDNILETEQSDELLDKIITWVGDAIEIMCEYNLVHGDMHFGNMGYRLMLKENDEIVLQFLLIDFGFSCCIKSTPCRPELELIQAVRTADYNKNVNKRNGKYLRDKLYEMYKFNYNSKLKNTLKDMDREWDKLFKKYDVILFADYK